MLNKLSFISRFIILILIILSVIIAKSLLWFIIITIFLLMLLLTSEKSVNECINFIKQIFIWLLFWAFMYIIIFRNIIGVLMFFYKLLICFYFIYLILYDVTFIKLENVFYTLLYPFYNRRDIKKYSYTMCVIIYYGIYFFDSRQYILEKNNDLNIKKYGLKHYLVPRLLFTEKKINELKCTLKFKYYKLHKEKIIKKDYKAIIIFLIVFIVAFIKEVIF